MVVFVGLVILAAVFGLAMWRLLRGPSFGDRLAAFHVAGLILALGILLLGGTSGSREMALFVALLVPALFVTAISLHKLSVQGAPSGALAPLKVATDGANMPPPTGSEHADG